MFYELVTKLNKQNIAIKEVKFTIVMVGISVNNKMTYKQLQQSIWLKNFTDVLKIIVFPVRGSNSLIMCVNFF